MENPATWTTLHKVIAKHLKHEPDATIADPIAQSEKIFGALLIEGAVECSAGIAWIIADEIREFNKLMIDPDGFCGLSCQSMIVNRLRDRGFIMNSYRE